jgi:hypothetical protein
VTDQRHHLALAEVEGDIRHGVETAVALADMVDANR